MLSHFPTSYLTTAEDSNHLLTMESSRSLRKFNLTRLDAIPFLFLRVHHITYITYHILNIITSSVFKVQSNGYFENRSNFEMFSKYCPIVCILSKYSVVPHFSMFVVKIYDNIIIDENSNKQGGGLRA